MLPKNSKYAFAAFCAKAQRLFARTGKNAQLNRDTDGVKIPATIRRAAAVLLTIVVSVPSLSAPTITTNIAPNIIDQTPTGISNTTAVPETATPLHINTNNATSAPVLSSATGTSVPNNSVDVDNTTGTVYPNTVIAFGGRKWYVIGETDSDNERIGDSVSFEGVTANTLALLATTAIAGESTQFGGTAQYNGSIVEGVLATQANALNALEKSLIKPRTFAANTTTAFSYAGTSSGIVISQGITNATVANGADAAKYVGAVGSLGYTQINDAVFDWWSYHNERTKNSGFIGSASYTGAYHPDKARTTQDVTANYWLLSVAEASLVKYGIRKSTGAAWWLRSPGNEVNTRLAFVAVSGNIYLGGGPSYAPDTNQTARPATFIDTKNILLYSGSGTSEGKALVPVGATGESTSNLAKGAALKLTVVTSDGNTIGQLADNVTLTVDTDSTNGTISYATSSAILGKGYNLSAVLVNNAGEFVNYWKLASLNDTANGTASISLPEAYVDDSAEYTLKVFVEKINTGDYADVASTPVVARTLEKRFVEITHLGETVINYGGREWLAIGATVYSASGESEILPGSVAPAVDADGNLQDKTLTILAKDYVTGDAVRYAQQTDASAYSSSDLRHKMDLLFANGGVNWGLSTDEKGLIENEITSRSRTRTLAKGANPLYIAKQNVTGDDSIIAAGDTYADLVTFDTKKVDNTQYLYQKVYLANNAIFDWASFDAVRRTTQTVNGMSVLAYNGYYNPFNIIGSTDLQKATFWPLSVAEASLLSQSVRESYKDEAKTTTVQWLRSPGLSGKTAAIISGNSSYNLTIAGYSNTSGLPYNSSATTSVGDTTYAARPAAWIDLSSALFETVSTQFWTTDEKTINVRIRPKPALTGVPEEDAGPIYTRIGPIDDASYEATGAHNLTILAASTETLKLGKVNIVADEIVKGENTTFAFEGASEHANLSAILTRVIDGKEKVLYYWRLAYDLAGDGDFDKANHIVAADGTVYGTANLFSPYDYNPTTDTLYFFTEKESGQTGVSDVASQFKTATFIDANRVQMPAPRVKIDYENERFMGLATGDGVFYTYQIEDVEAAPTTFQASADGTYDIPKEWIANEGGTTVIITRTAIDTVHYSDSEPQSIQITSRIGSPNGSADEDNYAVRRDVSEFGATDGAIVIGTYYAYKTLMGGESYLEYRNVDDKEWISVEVPEASEGAEVVIGPLAAGTYELRYSAIPASTDAQGNVYDAGLGGSDGGRFASLPDTLVIRHMGHIDTFDEGTTVVFGGRRWLATEITTASEKAEGKSMLLAKEYLSADNTAYSTTGNTAYSASSLAAKMTAGVASADAVEKNAIVKRNLTDVPGGVAADIYYWPLSYAEASKLTGEAITSYVKPGVAATIQWLRTASSTGGIATMTVQDGEQTLSLQGQQPKVEAAARPAFYIDTTKVFFATYTSAHGAVGTKLAGASYQATKVGPLSGTYERKLTLINDELKLGEVFAIGGFETGGYTEIAFDGATKGTRLSAALFRTDAEEGLDNELVYYWALADNLGNSDDVEYEEVLPDGTVSGKIAGGMYMSSSIAYNPKTDVILFFTESATLDATYLHADYASMPIKASREIGAQSEEPIPTTRIDFTANNGDGAIYLEEINDEGEIQNIPISQVIVKYINGVAVATYNAAIRFAVATQEEGPWTIAERDPETGYIDIEESWYGETLYVKREARTGAYLDSEPYARDLPGRLDAPNEAYVIATNDDEGSQDGSIEIQITELLSDKLEYRKKKTAEPFDAWISVTVDSVVNGKVLIEGLYAGRYELRYRADEEEWRFASKSLEIAVYGPQEGAPLIKTPAYDPILPETLFVFGENGVGNSYEIEIEGSFDSFTWSGSLPAGLSLASEGGVDGGKIVLSGTPTALTSPTTPEFTLVVSTGDAHSFPRNFAVVVKPLQLRVDYVAEEIYGLPIATVGDVYSRASAPPANNASPFTTLVTRKGVATNPNSVVLNAKGIIDAANGNRTRWYAPDTAGSLVQKIVFAARPASPAAVATHTEQQGNDGVITITQGSDAYGNLYDYEWTTDSRGDSAPATAWSTAGVNGNVISGLAGGTYYVRVKAWNKSNVYDYSDGNGGYAHSAATVVALVSTYVPPRVLGFELNGLGNSYTFELQGTFTSYSLDFALPQGLTIEAAGGKKLRIKGIATATTEAEGKTYELTTNTSEKYKFKVLVSEPLLRVDYEKEEVYGAKASANYFTKASVTATYGTAKKTSNASGRFTIATLLGTTRFYSLDKAVDQKIVFAARPDAPRLSSLAGPTPESSANGTITLREKTDEKSGHVYEYEYTTNALGAEAPATAWTTVGVSGNVISGLSAGTYYIRVKAWNDENASITDYSEGKGGYPHSSAALRVVLSVGAVSSEPPEIGANTAPAYVFAEGGIGNSYQVATLEGNVTAVAFEDYALGFALSTAEGEDGTYIVLSGTPAQKTSAAGQKFVISAFNNEAEATAEVTVVVQSLAFRVDYVNEQLYGGKPTTSTTKLFSKVTAGGNYSQSISVDSLGRVNVSTPINAATNRQRYYALDASGTGVQLIKFAERPVAPVATLDAAGNVVFADVVAAAAYTYEWATSETASVWYSLVGGTIPNVLETEDYYIRVAAKNVPVYNGDYSNMQGGYPHGVAAQLATDPPRSVGFALGGIGNSWILYEADEAFDSFALTKGAASIEALGLTLEAVDNNKVVKISGTAIATTETTGIKFCVAVTKGAETSNVVLRAIVDQLYFRVDYVNEQLYGGKPTTTTPIDTRLYTKTMPTGNYSSRIGVSSSGTINASTYIDAAANSRQRFYALNVSGEGEQFIKFAERPAAPVATLDAAGNLEITVANSATYPDKAYTYEWTTDSPASAESVWTTITGTGTTVSVASADFVGTGNISVRVKAWNDILCYDFSTGLGGWAHGVATTIPLIIEDEGDEGDEPDE